MLRLNKLIAFFIMLFALTANIVIAQQQEGPNDFNASEHIFLGQEFLSGFLPLGMICIAIFVIPLIIGLLIAIWIYQDANKRGKEGIIWGMVFIILSFFSIIGFVPIIILLIVWLSSRPPIVTKQPKKVHVDRRCPNCGRVIQWDAKACAYCAKKFD